MKTLAKAVPPRLGFRSISSRAALGTIQHCPLSLARSRSCLPSRFQYLMPNRTLPIQASQFSSTSRTWLQRIPKEPDASLADPELTTPVVAVNTNNDKVICAYFDKSGTLESDQRELTKNQIGEQFNLRHRDLRDIDLKSESVARILVRPATILLQFFDLCIITQTDEALLIDLKQTRSDKTAAFYRDFSQRLAGLKEAADVPDLPYELRAVEAALIAVLSIIREDLIEAKQEADKSAQDLRGDQNIDAFGLDLLFEQSRRLNRIEQRARLVRDTIREVLDADEDLAAMYLSDQLAGRPHDISDHQEAEYMLEAYHKAADGLAESAAAAFSMIRKSENLFRSGLAVQRNQIMFLEARIAIHTLGLAAGTLVAGLFGMNLVNYFEEAPYGFAVTTGICITLSFIFSAFGMRSIRRIQTVKEIQFPTTRRRGR